MSNTHGKSLCIIFLLCTFPLVLPRFAVAKAASPVDYVRSVLAQVTTIQTDPQLAGPTHRSARKKRISTVILNSFDMDRMAQNALGDHWNKLGQSQRKEFTAVFSDLFQDSYSRMVLNFLKGEKIDYSPEKANDAEPVVKTVILRPNENIPVDYHLEKLKARWRIHDVIIDGVSIVHTYHNSFNRVITEKSYPFLLEKLRLQQKAIQVDS